MSWAAAWRLITAAIQGVTGAAEAEPLRIEYRRIQAMTCKGNRRVRIDPDGKVFVDVVTRDCLRGTDWNGPWPKEALRILRVGEMKKLRDTVAGSGFFDLPEKIERAGHDGYRDELDVGLGGHHHSVTVERAELPAAFTRLRGAVLAASRPPWYGI